ncbi:hypothetical protein GY45DRAFT_1316902 [Cubamyces sp. BRFM 1775]|nr:hypothetical protein GY45DRAFT_1316902 [Cubamyces sp. BRFM 1775]
MASTASPSTPSGGVSASMWAGQPPARNGWSRNGESGSAFRGVSSRGRPGRGAGGRGGRGGRGGGRAGGPNSPRPDDKPSKQNGDQPKDQPKKDLPPPTSTSSATSISDVSSSLPPKPQTRPNNSKPPARKPSESKQPRKLPPIVVNPPPASSNNAPPSATTPNRARRKRSQNKGSTSSVASKKSPSSESSTSLLRVEKSPVITKDLPPHLAPPPPAETPSFDIKHDIDALVERVRAVAMDRPHTPGSHIDWAGDDDDSLPDLDDWGVKNVNEKSSTVPAQSDLISPILVDALKPLPNLEFGSPQTAAPAPLESRETAPAAVLPQPSIPPLAKTDDGDHTPRGPPAPSRAKETAKEPVKEKSVTGDTKKESQTAASGSVPLGEQKAKGASKSPQRSKAPIHPSLPPKPVAVVEPAAKRAPRKPPVPLVKTTEPEATDEPPTTGVAESMHAPKPSETAQPESSSKESSPERQGLAASMHAPMPSSMSAPSHITTHSTPSSTSFQPTHGRAHTVGRPNGVRIPFSPSHGAFPDSGPHPHAEHERVSHRERINHARTHSSPPTGPGTATARARTVHASRPIITGAALSQLARAIGAEPRPKRDAAPAAAAATKE